MDDSGTPGSPSTLAVNCLGSATLRIEQLETKGRKVRPNTDITSTAVGKEEMAVHL
jgi:hypothetical protein